MKYSITETGKELNRRPYAPGQHGQRRTKISEYGVQLQEKQKVRFTYGVSEKQFKKTFNEDIAYDEFLIPSNFPEWSPENYFKLVECKNNRIFCILFNKRKKTRIISTII